MNNKKQNSKAVAVDSNNGKTIYVIPTEKNGQGWITALITFIFIVGVGLVLFAFTLPGWSTPKENEIYWEKSNAVWIGVSIKQHSHGFFNHTESILMQIGVAFSFIGYGTLLTFIFIKIKWLNSQAMAYTMPLTLVFGMLYLFMPFIPIYGTAIISFSMVFTGFLFNFWATKINEKKAKDVYSKNINIKKKNGVYGE
ncbi:MAG: hypothetical protein K4H23_04620 [Mollicutes bacterium PWAP]|nr:hypothetical protein [Mollicutes bacterium PWAP]